ncbi:MAG TPA: hypothetical protein VF406_05750 [Thermodesulfobacteriota bacterium]
MTAHPHRFALVLLAAVLVAWLGAMRGITLAGGSAASLPAPGASLPMCGHAAPAAPFTTGGETR